VDNETQPSAQEICSIRIAFPVESDEQAVSYKKKISNVLADIPTAQIQFSIMSMPVGLPNAAQIR